MVKKKRFDIVSFLYILTSFFCVALIAYRIGELSLNDEIEGINLQVFANSRTTQKDIYKSKRGTIYDVNGTALAQDVSSYTLVAYLVPLKGENANNPKHVIDKELTADKLSLVLDIPKEQVLTYLNKDSQGAKQVEFGTKGRNLTELKKDEILALNLPGLDFIETQKRYYPFGNFLSYTLGYAKMNKILDDNGNELDEITGEMGVELYCNKELTGSDGYTMYQKDRNGYKIAGTNEVVVDSVNGNDVYLTIDSTIQLFVEQAINDTASVCPFEWATVMVADAKTGAILATASDPSFDPNYRNITKIHFDDLFTLLKAALTNPTVLFTLSVNVLIIKVL